MLVVALFGGLGGGLAPTHMASLGRIVNSTTSTCVELERDTHETRAQRTD
jgi:hypothetical protein